MQEKNPYAPIIGVVGNVSEGSILDDPEPTIFYSHRQMNETGMTLFVRTNQPAALHRSAPEVTPHTCYSSTRRPALPISDR